MEQTWVEMNECNSRGRWRGFRHLKLLVVNKIDLDPIDVDLGKDEGGVASTTEVMAQHHLSVHRRTSRWHEKMNQFEMLPFKISFQVVECIDAKVVRPLHCTTRLSHLPNMTVLQRFSFRYDISSVEVAVIYFCRQD